jgi:hypothetical protein
VNCWIRTASLAGAAAGACDAKPARLEGVGTTFPFGLASSNGTMLVLEYCELPRMCLQFTFELLGADAGGEAVAGGTRASEDASSLSSSVACDCSLLPSAAPLRVVFSFLGTENV